MAKGDYANTHLETLICNGKFKTWQQSKKKKHMEHLHPSPERANFTSLAALNTKLPG